MKAVFSAVFALFAIGLLARDQPPAGLYNSYTGFAIPSEPVLPSHEVHPSLWFKANDLPALKARFKADDFAVSRWDAMQKIARLDLPLPPAPDPKDATEAIHKYYGAMSIAARAHALVALFADDAGLRAAHRQRAQELLLRAYDGPIFALDSRVKGSAIDEIYRGSWLQNYAHAYDCLQATLAPEIDAQIRARLVLEAECVYEHLYAWTETSPHNHLSKPAWGLGSIALTLSDHPRAKLWLGRAIEAANKNTRYFFSGDGLYREGSHYLIFSLTNFVPFLFHYRNVSGVDGFTAFQPAFEAMVKTRNSHGWMPNIEDSYIRPTPTHLVASAYREAKTKLHSFAPLSEILTWSYFTADLAPFEQERKDSGFNYTGASWDYPLEIDELLTHDASIQATAPDISPTIFLSGGQTIFRNRWAGTNAGQRYLLFHGVAVADNHNHDDQLSFLLEAEGQMMSSDSGYSRGTYVGAERTDWYLTAAAHNTLTIGGRPADKDPSNITPPSRFRTEQPGLFGEAKRAFFGSDTLWDRSIFWIADDYYAVVDQVVSKKSLGAVKSFFHGGRAALRMTGGEFTWIYTADRYGPSASLRTWLIAPGATTTEKKGELTYIKGDFAAFPYLETVSRDYSSPWITVMKPMARGDVAPFTVADRSAGGVSAVVITTPTHRTLIAARNLPSSNVEIEGIESNALLIVVRRDLLGKILNAYGYEGTYLRVDGRAVPMAPK